MTDEHLRELQRRFRASGAPDDERAYLAKLAQVDREKVALAARFGSAAAAAALEAPAADPPPIFRCHDAAKLQELFGSWEAALVYTRCALHHVLEWWASRGPEYVESVQELRLTWTAASQWFDGERTEEASRIALAWARSGNARADLVSGRFRREGRSLWHLALALGGLAYVCAPLDEPFRSDQPQGRPRSPLGVPLDAARIRLQRVVGNHFEVYEAIKGVMYVEHPGLCMTQPEYASTLDAALRPFEALAARGLLRWLAST